MSIGYHPAMTKTEARAALTPWLEAAHLHDCAAADAQIDALIGTCSALAEHLGQRDAEVDHLRAIIANLRRDNDRLRAEQAPETERTRAQLAQTIARIQSWRDDAGRD